MVYLFRIFLISLLVYLVLRIFRSNGDAEEPVVSGNSSGKKSKVPDDLGEYIDYEEIKD